MAIPNVTSRVHVAINALLAALRARDLIQANGVQVADGLPGEPQPEMIAIRGVTDWSQEWSQMAGSSTTKEETFSIQVHIRVLRGRLETTIARARAFELLTELEETLRTDKTVTDTVWVGALHRGEYVNAQTGQNSEAKLEMLVDCRARI